jgi:hypothetical protein
MDSRPLLIKGGSRGNSISLASGYQQGGMTADSERNDDGMIYVRPDGKVVCTCIQG